MDKSNTNIVISVFNDVFKLELRAIDERDLDNLRDWKNAQREYFFYKDLITLAQHKKWFLTYQKRPEDHMFMVLVNDVSIGCMGIRLLEGRWDVYNVILGSAKYGGKGLMSKAFQAMIHFATTRYPNQVALQVIKKNPAIVWYQKNGFKIFSEHSGYFYMLHQLENLS